MWSKIKPYIIAILIPLAVGGLAAFLTRNSMNIYDQLNRPPLTPPGIVFPIVWTILYTLMGISSAMIYHERKANPMMASMALATYAKQLVLNFFWSIIFFNLQNYLLAFIWLIFLWVSIIKMIYEFYQINKTAAYLQIPYLIWVTFAGYLNLAIYLLNR